MNEEIDPRPSLPEPVAAAPAGHSAATSDPAAASQPTAASQSAAASQSSASKASSASTAASASQPSSATQHAPAWRNPWLVVALLALGLAAWQWVETRQKLADTQQELARRLADNDSVGVEVRGLAKQSQEQVAGVLGRLGALEAKIAESQSQQATLERLYQDLASNRDEWALAEVEQGVTLAAQQLQLAGNVHGAVLALQAADARLAASDRPQLISLRKTLAGDLDRLRALPQIDTAGMSLRLEGVINAIDKLPLAADGRPRAGEASPKEQADVLANSAAESSSQSPSVISAEFWQRLASVALWQRLAGEFWGELKSLVRIQRFDRDEPALLAPGQVFFLRENLKLRLLNARLALLARDQWTFRNELQHAQAWIDRYFDAGAASQQAAQESLKQLAETEITIEMPTLNDSLSAIKTFKLGQERK
ncbi:MAG TPA: uroporphyrinogen-III C-methyltransferase [Accumulibacter sp.]|nr:uroporphyrinogen-III C-methyltransferase [Accumulibacter sp.]